AAIGPAHRWLTVSKNLKLNFCFCRCKTINYEQETSRSTRSQGNSQGIKMSGSYLYMNAGQAEVSLRAKNTHPSSNRQQSKKHRQDRARPRSVISQRFSQVYDMAVDHRPPCLQKGAVTPALWLVCQTILVALFAVCCVFLLNNRGLKDGRISASSAMSMEKKWIGLRLELQVQNKTSSIHTSKTANYQLKCAEAEEYSCFRMTDFFHLRHTDRGSEVLILLDGVYRINAALTLRLKLNGQSWISCIETVFGLYTHCTIFGTRYLRRGSVLTFSSLDSGQSISRLGHLTYFEIEMRQWQPV
uniref:TNF_2 domain-containing protein n=1 Tax=Macrostomum lignano TaxID=282301 RepID=A0A1I8IXE1_9PLAT